MIVKCSYCGGALKFDADIQMMVCDHCTSMFAVEETEEEKKSPLLTADDTTNADTDGGLHMTDGKSASNNIHMTGYAHAEGSMECDIYECKSCGAQLVLNGVEAATYCAYCGQPTIVFERIARRRRPKYIIPFSIPKNIAIANIRAGFLRGKFVPEEIKNFEPDLLRGIYVPYMLCDIRYKDRQLIRGRSSAAKTTNIAYKYYYREAVGAFHEIPVDASVRLSNESSQRLEPFYNKDMVDFKAEYLSGFYADLKDDNALHVDEIALSRAKDMFNEQILKTVAAGECTIRKNMPYFEFEKKEYVLFPVWFMVFHRNKQIYTILVNGQTGKVVGALPPDRKKVAGRFLVLALIFSILGFLLLPAMAAIEGDARSVANYLIFLGIPSLLAAGCHNLRSLQKSRSLTTEETIKSFVTERQDS